MRVRLELPGRNEESESCRQLRAGLEQPDNHILTGAKHNDELD